MIRLIVAVLFATVAFRANAQRPLTLFAADHTSFQYTGRIDFSNPKAPRFWQPGVYVQARFSGIACEIKVRDQMLWGKSHNYVSIDVDGKVRREKTTALENSIRIDSLSPGEHTITICKSTEAGIGYMEFVGLACEKLLTPSKRPKRKIEFIGNSITCGTGTDQSIFPCGQGEWYDQHNAYESYGPTVARALNAQWHLSSVSGIGLMHSCCDMTIVMPQVFDKMNMRDNVGAWNFDLFTPDVVTVTLGQNDGKQDSLTFCKKYVDFLVQLRSHYPKAQLVCVTSPMADENLRRVLQQYLTGVVDHLRKKDKKVTKFFYSRSWNSGCGGHPDLKEHQLMAAELTAYLKKLMKW